MSSDSIRFSKLNGHQGSVLCLDISDEAYGGKGLLLSGSEDKTARLWDLRDSTQRQRACACVQAGGDVLSAVFAPSIDTEENSESILNGEFAKDCSIYLSVDRFVFEYDLRKLDSPLAREPTRDLSSILQNQDEVNQICVTTRRPPASSNKKKKGKKIKSIDSGEESLFIASADDAGTVRFMDASPASANSQIIHHDPNGVAVVLSSAFRPNSKSFEMASGGSDCKLCLWDLAKPRRPLSSYDIMPLDGSQDGDGSKPQVCNPPMVHTMSWSHSGRLLATGLGDGRCAIFSVENRSLVQIGSLPPGHDASVASVLFPSFTQDNERFLVSAGNDGAILCWDIGSTVLESNIPISPDEMFPPDLIQNNTSEISTSMDRLSVNDGPKVLFGIDHKDKPNWMVSKKDPSTLFVCDTSSSITSYRIPMR